MHVAYWVMSKRRELPETHVRLVEHSVFFFVIPLDIGVLEGELVISDNYLE